MKKLIKLLVACLLACITCLGMLFFVGCDGNTPPNDGDGVEDDGGSDNGSEDGGNDGSDDGAEDGGNDGSDDGGNDGSDNGADGSDGVQLEEFVGLTFTSKTVTYDGQEHEIVVVGTVPEDADIVYTANKATDAGTYQSKAVISADGYETLTLTATLKINKATFTGITFDGKSFVHNGEEKGIYVQGELPLGTEVSYTANTATAKGEYTATAVLTNPNYTTLTLTAEWEITSVVAVAADIVNALVERPDPWSFMPEVFLPENMAYTAMPVGGKEGANSFGTSVQVDSMGKRSIGKQFNVLYDTLNTSATLIGYVDTVYGVAGVIANVYQTYLNDNPDDTAQFSGTAGGFAFQISLNGTASTLLAGNSTFCAELSYDSAQNVRTGRIQLTDGAAVKYESSANHLKVAYMATVKGVGVLTELEFIREDGVVVGYMYEHMGTEGTAIKSSAVICADQAYTRIISNKRETDDLIINGYEEVYSSVTGEMIGGRVSETVSLATFDTLWVNVYDVEGMNTVRVDDAQNSLNADSIYVNGNSTPFKSEKVGGLNLKRESRKYDIEMKDVWYVVATVQGEETTYQTVKTQIPMVFVQYEQVETFATDVETQNEYLSNVSLPVVNMAVINQQFESMKTTFATILENASYSQIKAYIGNKHSFFNSIA